MDHNDKRKEFLLESKCLIKCHSATGGERVNAEKHKSIRALRLVHPEGPVMDHSIKGNKKMRKGREGCELTMFGLAVVGEIFDPSSMSCFRCVQVTKSERKAEWSMNKQKARKARRRRE